MATGSRAILASALLASALLTAPAMAQNRIFYVDFQSGNDSADGLSPATAWQHAPGDVAAPAKIQRFKLQPGDQVRFRGGVRYRHQLTPYAAGTTENPAVFDGSSWGPVRAIFDGSEPLTGARRCVSAADCLGNPNWQALWRADFPADRSWTDYLFVDDQIYQPAQYPDLSVADSDDPDSYLPIALSELTRLTGGEIRHALPAGLNKGSPALALWVNPNAIAFNLQPTISRNGVTFDPAGNWINSAFKPYTNRDSRFSLFNIVNMVTRPGLFAASPADGIVIFWPRPPATRGPGSYRPSVSIGGRRLGINTGKAENLTIRGFSFTNYSGEPKNMSQGTAIMIRNSTMTGIAVTHNNFQSITNLGGPAMLHVAFAQNLRVEHNQFSNGPWVSAMMIDNSKGPVVVRCNSITGIGRTGIRFLNVKDGSIIGNRLSNINGVHGNAITAYGDLRNVLIAGNVVTNSIRPLTVKGVGNGSLYFDSGTPSVTIRNNVLMGNNSVNGAITVYSDTPNLTISNNFLYSEPYAIKITGQKSDFAATGNQLVGGIIQPKDSQLLSPAGNTSLDPAGNGAALVEQMSQMTPSAGLCS